MQIWQTKTFAIMTHATIPGDCIDRQQQNSTSDTHVPSLWKQGKKREDETGVQNVTDHSTEADLVHRKMRHTSSNMDVDTHLDGREVNTDVFPDDGANNQIIARIKIGSHKICMREDLAKEKMVFSQESSQAIFEMGNVELIHSKTSRIQSMPMMSTLLLRRNYSLRMRQAYQTRPRNDTTYQSSF